MRVFENIRRDMIIGLRGLIRQPGFTVAALVTLALGIGANTAVFSVIRHVLLAPLPYQDADRVVMIWSKWTGFPKTWVSDAEALDYKKLSSVVDAGAWGGTQVNLTGDDADPARVGAAFVTANTFTILGVTPRVGRTFTDAEAQPTRGAVRDSERRALAASLRRRRESGRQDDARERHRARDRRHHAARISVADGLRR